MIVEDKKSSCRYMCVKLSFEFKGIVDFGRESTDGVAVNSGISQTISPRSSVPQALKSAS